MKTFQSLLSKRGFPLSLEAFKACSTSYSQFGEDMIVASLFPKEEPCGFYLDLGCYHPLRYSNTYHFYRRGWSGVSVDASSNYQKFWQQYRPRDKHLVCAITPTASHRFLDFVESKQYPATSYCRVEKQAQSESIDEQDNTSSIKTLAIAELARWWPYSAPPKIVSTDLEGLDYETWMHFPFLQFKPKVLIIEQHDNDQTILLIEYLRDFGYGLYGSTGPSLIFLFETD